MAAISLSFTHLGYMISLPIKDWVVQSVGQWARYQSCLLLWRHLFFGWRASSADTARASREIRDLDHAKEVKATLEGAAVTVTVKVGAAGRLFGSVTDKDVANAIKAATGLDVDRHSIKTAGHIKTIGAHAVKVSLPHHVVASVTVTVVAA